GHGSSSCPYSSDGAEAAVQVAAEILAEMLHDDIRKDDNRLQRQIEAGWKDAVEKLHTAKEREEPFEYILYGTTLIAVAASDKFIFALQIGDGNILMMNGSKAEPVLAIEESVGEDTESLCLNNAWTFVRTQIIPWDDKSGAEMFLLSTDGYANSFSDSSGFIKAGEDFYKLWKNEGLSYIDENLEGWLRRSSDKGSGDDIAIALLAFKKEAK
ncbi:MAG: protein phosphatase 2C domain-containing protein, partial [Clostridiales bacterium]|nr:protein phosphatase 2C domain-containing protein [Clostridiales bacterium]